MKKHIDTLLETLDQAPLEQVVETEALLCSLARKINMRLNAGIYIRINTDPRFVNPCAQIARRHTGLAWHGSFSIVAGWGVIKLRAVDGPKWQPFLRELQEAGAVIHRDAKPDNILYDPLPFS